MHKCIPYETINNNLLIPDFYREKAASREDSRMEYSFSSPFLVKYTAQLGL